MQGLVPSTMGTLMSTGVMYGGKAVGDKPEMDAKDLAAFLEGFAAGIQKRGKCQPGDRTIYDSALKAAEAGKKALEEGGGMKAVMDAAVEDDAEVWQGSRFRSPRKRCGRPGGRCRHVPDGRTSKIFQLTGTPVSSIFISKRKPLQQHAAGAFSLRLGLISFYSTSLRAERSSSPVRTLTTFATL